MTDELLNELLEFVEIGFCVIEKIMDSGQRSVYKSIESSRDNKFYVLKISVVKPTSVKRIQREYNILSTLDSEYFPKTKHIQFVTKEDIDNYIDNIDFKKDLVKRKQIESFDVKPFLVTVEEFIEHISWDEACKKFIDEHNVYIEFLKHVFKGLGLLWDEKIVHRDLKPDNILVTSDYKPVIIDLGIAKSFRDGTQALTNVGFNSPCTPPFAAPEQFSLSDVQTYKIDQFSIGILSYLLFAKKFPYGDLNEIEIHELLQNMKNGRADKLNSVSGVSLDLSNFIHKLLNYNAYKRYRNLSGIMNDLNEME